MKKFIIVFISLFFLTVCTFAQQATIAGQVRKADGEPVAGVRVSVKGASTATSTDQNGLYRIAAGGTEKILVFTALGYKEQEVAVGNRTVVNIELVEEQLDIDEVVVVGYGELRKKDMTGAVSSIKPEQLENNLIQSLDDALAGKVAGLMVQSGGGQPGSASNILIRGANSLTGSTQPLIVVDGFPLFEVSTSTGGGMSDKSGELSAFSFINPDDIASIEVLKDASATAIYGNRGANGVIIITTKKGKGAGTKLQYNTYFSSQELPWQYSMLNFQDYVKYQASYNPTRNLFINQQTGQPYDFDPRIRTINWQDEIYRTGMIQNHSLSLQSSSDKTSFMASGSFMDNKSIIKNTDWKKFTGKLTVDHNFSEKLKVGADLSFSQIKDEGVVTGGGDGSTWCGDQCHSGQTFCPG